jgi:hypothetical protein
VNIKDIYAPANVIGQNFKLGDIIGNMIYNIIIFSAITAFFFLVFAGFQYITAGGDKNKIAQAQQWITYTIIGLILITFAFLITSILGEFIGFNFFKRGIIL